jgi:Protein of unknown function (DUF1353)
MGHGEFSGEPEAVWLTEDGTEDRQMKILQDFHFVDLSSKKWRAPAGSVVDGASIPRALWTIVGSPYTGDYRRASVVHDVACDEAGGDKKKRRAADRMFFHACRAGGCSIWQAILLYLGVRIGAAASEIPAWQAAVATETAGPRIRRTDDELRLERDFQVIADRVLAPGETDDPEEVERRTDEALSVVAGLKGLRSGKK